jgi:hypothetical protein
MKITLKKIIYLIAFIGFTLGAKAQNVAIADTTRISLGVDASIPGGNFGNSYTVGAGASFQVDVPLTEKLYFTANLGFNSFFPNNAIATNPYAINNVKLNNMNLVPLKVGLKYFLIRTFYIQGEAGESLLLNKTGIYALNSTAIVFAPQLGIVFKLKNKNYIDAGIRYEFLQSFYGDGAYNHYLAARVAYAINL